MNFLPQEFAIDSQEWAEILTSVIAISLSLSFVNGGMDVDSAQFVFLMAVFGITVGSGFVLHELAHKYVAIKFGSRARFRAWIFGLVLMLSLAIVPQLMGWGVFPLFLAPGAVMIYAQRRISLKENGLISAAGPAVNIMLAGVFFALSTIFFSAVNVVTLGEYEIALPLILVMGFRVNMFLAMFNLLPIFPLDGFKVVRWDWKIWLLMFLVSFLGSGLAGL
ncbi:hypothetical protein COU37_00905 [Candidatus Micrarchaeota archaeon CG10_big_fil_rev_8_21_14_0_10_45_29]|nr:MAG: hypothetical protein COU37_00905 [Candidatus Micrarchaeota archaeon CG10_big_fil_rev_8_21_14_0_10_45_29]